MIRIAIDGPGGAGKSTIAKQVARALDIDYIDTGAMYRAVGYKLIRDNVDMYDEDALLAMLEATDIDFSGGKTILDGEDISDRIRTQEISRKASECSALAPVRAKLVELQKKMGSTKSVIMDGRDIGTYVLPDAELKIFLTATVEERANRRCRELREKGVETDFEAVKKDMEYRDKNDSGREFAPLKPAEDSVYMDNTDMTLEESIDKVCELARAERE